MFAECPDVQIGLTGASLTEVVGDRGSRRDQTPIDLGHCDTV